MSVTEAQHIAALEAEVNDLHDELRNAQARKTPRTSANERIDAAVAIAREQVDTIIRMSALLGSVNGSTKATDDAVQLAAERGSDVINILADSITEVMGGAA